MRLQWLQTILQEPEEQEEVEEAAPEVKPEVKVEAKAEPETQTAEAAKDMLEWESLTIPLGWRPLPLIKVASCLLPACSLSHMQ